MPFINAAAREIHCKIVYYGPGLGGKTTNLEFLYRRIPQHRRGSLTSLKTAGDRTIYFDFLPLDLGTVAGMRTRFHLYTVPGQPRYNLSRRLVLQGADGVVFVADSSRSRFFANRESLDNLRENLALAGIGIDSVPLVLQYNKRDLPDAVDVRSLERLLNAAGRPSFEAIAIEGLGVVETLKAVVSGVLEKMARIGEGVH